MNQREAFKSYNNTKINTANQGKLLLMLYEAMIKNLIEARDKIEDYRYNDFTNEKLKKANDIIEELISSLNMEAGGTLTERLKSIYLYMFSQITKANVEKRKEPLIECIGLAKDLLEAWKFAVEKEEGDFK